MDAVSQLVRLFTRALAFTSLVVGSPIALRAQEECSLSKTNNNCTITIDRSNPVAPSMVQMYSKQTLTVVIKNPLPFERYFLDFTTGQAAVSPDVASFIVGGIATSNYLGKLTEALVMRPPVAVVQDVDVNKEPTPPCSDLNLDRPDLPYTSTVQSRMPSFARCFASLANKAQSIYEKLEPLIGPDALTSHSSKPADYYFAQRAPIRKDIDDYMTKELALSKKIALMSQAAAVTDKSAGLTPDPNAPKTAPAPPAPAPGPVPPAPAPGPAPPAPASAPSQYTVEDEAAISQLAVYQKLIDAVTADLAGYQQRLNDLGPCGYVRDANKAATGIEWDRDASYNEGDRVSANGHCYRSKMMANKDKGVDNTNYWESWSYEDGMQPPSVTISSRTDNDSIYSKMVTRTITYSLDTLNLVSYSQQAVPSASNKKAIATVAINFADQSNTHLGRPYSALRWEASAGVFLSWLPNRSFTLVPNNATPPVNVVQDNKTRPTPVAFGAGSYRLTSDLGGKWKQNFYLTGAVGVNTNNSTAEFGVGPSYAWRLLMISALCHFGHDTKPASMTPGSGGNLPTAWHWTENAALGISVRIPALTGR